MAIAGKVAITPKGEWNAETDYTKLDLVFYENASYVATKPSTGVLPTDETHWMLVVQSAGGADLEGIINGDIQVGNAKTLDGKGLDYFFPKSGGTIVNTSLAPFGIKNMGENNKTAIAFYNGDTVYGYLGFDGANSPIIIQNDYQTKKLLHEGNMASHVLPLTGGRLSKNKIIALEIENTAGNASVIDFYGADGRMGAIGFNGKNVPIYQPSEGGANTLLHTGNKPTGSYTGNGDATQRTITICVNPIDAQQTLRILGNGMMAIVTSNGAFVSEYDNSIIFLPNSNVEYKSGILTLTTNHVALNNANSNYYYEVL